MLFCVLEAKYRSPNEASFLAAGAFFDAGEGAGAAQIFKEEILALHDASGKGKDLRGEVILIHLDPFAEHADPILIDARGERVLITDQVEEGSRVFDIEAIHIAKATDAGTRDHVLEFMDFVMIGGHGVADFIGRINQMAIDAKRASNTGGYGDEIKRFAVLKRTDIGFG